MTTEQVIVPGRRLGKLPPRVDKRTLRLASYIRPRALYRVPPKCDWSTKYTAWGMLANDVHGDCTCAALGHQIQTWDSQTGRVPSDITDDAVLALYALVNGGQDNGADMLTVLNTFRTTGLASHKLGAFAALEHTDWPPRRDRMEARMLKYAINTFGGAYIGLALPVTAQSQATWDYVKGVNGNEPGSWGGHAVNAIAYDRVGYTIITWGGLKKVTWRFHYAYCDEQYALLSEEWLMNGKSPMGFDLATLQADLAAITG